MTDTYHYKLSCRGCRTTNVYPLLNLNFLTLFSFGHSLLGKHLSCNLYVSYKTTQSIRYSLQKTLADCDGDPPWKYPHSGQVHYLLADPVKEKAKLNLTLTQITHTEWEMKEKERRIPLRDLSCTLIVIYHQLITKVTNNCLHSTLTANHDVDRRWQRQGLSSRAGKQVTDFFGNCLCTEPSGVMSVVILFC